MPRRSEGRLVLLCEVRQFQTLLRQVLRIQATHVAHHLHLFAPLRIVARAILLAGFLERPVYSMLDQFCGQDRSTFFGPYSILALNAPRLHFWGVKIRLQSPNLSARRTNPTNFFMDRRSLLFTFGIAPAALVVLLAAMGSAVLGSGFLSPVAPGLGSTDASMGGGCENESHSGTHLLNGFDYAL